MIAQKIGFHGARHAAIYLPRGHAVAVSGLYTDTAKGSSICSGCTD